MHRDHELFLEALFARRRVLVEFFKVEGGPRVARACAPLDYGPSTRRKDGADLYHLFDFDGSSGGHPVSLLPGNIVRMTATDEEFEPSAVVTWKPNWYVKRDWNNAS